MTADPIDRLRRADPVDGGGDAPAFEDVMARIRREEAETATRRRTGRTGRRRWSRALAPALSLAVTAGVVGVVVVAASHHRGQRARPTSTGAVAEGTSARQGAAVPPPARLAPTGRARGMRGLVFGLAVDGAGSTLRVSFVQCTNCGRSTPPDARDFNWASTSVDGGRHWRTGRTPLSLVDFGPSLPEGRDVWAEGYLPHDGNPRFLVSHDGGRSYHSADSRAQTADQPVRLGGGRAWTLGTRCVDYRCRSSVLHGISSGSQLTRTATQPPGMPTRRAPTALLVAGDGDRAYVGEGDHRALYTSGDDGHSWTQASYPCRLGTRIGNLTSSDGVVWVTCARAVDASHGIPSTSSNRELTLRRSDDAGRHWRTPAPSFHAAANLLAVSPTIAWAVGPTGAVARTGNGGRSWETVLRGAGQYPSVDIASATTATVVATVTTGTIAAHTRRTDFVAYRTTDGGAHWTHSVIHLPVG